MVDTTEPGYGEMNGSKTGFGMDNAEINTGTSAEIMNDDGSRRVEGEINIVIR